MSEIKLPEEPQTYQEITISQAANEYAEQELGPEWLAYIKKETSTIETDDEKFHRRIQLLEAKAFDAGAKAMAEAYETQHDKIAHEVGAIAEGEVPVPFSVKDASPCNLAKALVVDAQFRAHKVLRILLRKPGIHVVRVMKNYGVRVGKEAKLYYFPEVRLTQSVFNSEFHMSVSEYDRLKKMVDDGLVKEADETGRNEDDQAKKDH